MSNKDQSISLSSTLGNTSSLNHSTMLGKTSHHDIHHISTTLGNKNIHSNHHHTHHMNHYNIHTHKLFNENSEQSINSNNNIDSHKHKHIHHYHHSTTLGNESNHSVSTTLGNIKNDNKTNIEYSSSLGATYQG